MTPHLLDVLARPSARELSPPEPSRAPAYDAAVIDVGSNSVRLVIYRIDGRAIWTIFNEKVLAGLGRDMAVTGRLSPQGVATAMLALRRFRAVLDAAHPAQIFAAATAAVRDAEDGAEFLARVEAEAGLRIRILSGEDEARYAALGVLAGEPTATGVVADLGGASLELTRLTADGPGRGVTLPLGPFSLGVANGFDADRVAIAAARALAPIAQDFQAGTLHAVGGAWRNLALLHMRLNSYPLHVVHQFDIGRDEALATARLIASQSQSSLDRTPGFSKKRAETLPYAAVVLEQLIRHLDLQCITLSAFGVREGLLLEAMDPQVRSLDPLIEGCAALAAQSIDDGLGAQLETWLKPVFDPLPRLFGDRDGVLLAASTRLADLGARLHPDHRADLVFEQVLRAPIAGMIHAERAFLAAAAYARHSSRFDPPEPDTLARILTPERILRARTVGAAVRLGCDLSGRSPKLLRKTTLCLTDEVLCIAAAPGYADMLLGEQTAKRGGTLARLLGVKLRLQGG